MNVTSTKRQNMTHLEAMKDLDFIALCQSLDSGTLNGLKTVMKVDGLAARFGKDKDGNIFFESARSGPVFEPGTFSIYTMEKGGSNESIERSRHYDNLLLFFKISGVLKDLPNNTKIVCEVLYTPLAQEEDDGFRFVSVKYSKKAITKKLTVLPYYAADATTGERFDDEKSQALFVMITENEEMSLISPMLSMGTIDVSSAIAPALNVSDDELAALGSLKHADKPLKAEVRARLSGAKNAMAATILQSEEIHGKYALGEEIEGVVVWINNQEYKCTTPEFKNSKAK